MVSLSCSLNWQRSAERWKEDLPNSAIFKLSCRSKYFGSFWKRRLKDTEPKCLRSKSSSIVTIPMALLYIQSNNVVIVWQKFPNPVGVARDGDGMTNLDRQAHIAAHWWSVFLKHWNWNWMFWKYFDNIVMYHIEISWKYCMYRENNKLAKLRRHTSQVHFAKIHFGWIHFGKIHLEINTLLEIQIVVPFSQINISLLADFGCYFGKKRIFGPFSAFRQSVKTAIYGHFSVILAETGSVCQCRSYIWWPGWSHQVSLTSVQN